MRRIDPTEHQIQAAIVEWAYKTKMVNKYNPERIIYLKDHLIAIPNGGKRSITEAIRLKKEGVKPGVSDLFLACPSFNGKNKNGLWIEVKSKRGKVSRMQYEWSELMQGCHYAVSFIYSVDEGIQAIKDYLGME